VSIFLRQVEFSHRGQRYAAAHDALRTYFAQRAPDLAPYLLLPTISDRGVIGTIRVRRWRRDVMSLAGTVALVNSALGALAVGLLLGTAVEGWLPAIGAVVVFTAALGAQIGYLRHVGHQTHGEIDRLIRARVGRLGSHEALVPSDGGGIGE
jgi:hypothetical protein